MWCIEKNGPAYHSTLQVTLRFQHNLGPLLELSPYHSSFSNHGTSGRQYSSRLSASLMDVEHCTTLFVHEVFFPLERPLFIRLPLMKEPWRHLSFFWILAILNNQYCYLFPLAPILVEGTAIYQLWSLLREKLNSTRLGQTSMAREKELFITVFFLRPVPCPLSI